MKWVVVRRTMHGKRLGLFIWQVTFSLLAIGLSLMIAFVEDTAVAGQLVALMTVIWTLGWFFGPMIYSSRDLALQIDYFRSLPVPSKKFADAFTISSFIGLSVPVTLLSFLSIVVYAYRLEPWLALVAIPLVVIQVLMIVLFAKIIAVFLKRHVKTHFGSFVSSFVIGGVLAFFATGWFALGSINSIIQNGLPEQWIQILKFIPSVWSVSAIEAFARQDWSAAVFAGLLLVTTIAIWILWRHTFIRLLTLPRSSRTSNNKNLTVIEHWPDSPTLAVIQRELTAWKRDYTRSSLVFFAFFYSVFVCIYPIDVNLTVLLPFMGILFAISAAGSTANGYGIDGSMFWQLLTTPKAYRHDILGRQITWLIIVAPVAVILTIIGLAIAGFPVAAWIHIFGLLIAALGAGAGLSILIAVYYVISLRDPHVRGNDANENNVEWGQFMLTAMGVLILTALPIIPWWLSVRLNIEWISYFVFPLAIVVATLTFVLMGEIALRRLQIAGASILQTLIHGEPMITSTAKPQTTQQTASIYIRAILGSLLLFPQGLVPIIFKLTGNQETRVWFLAMYLPDGLGWLVAVVMCALGIWLWYGIFANSASEPKQK